jgi:YD repeat-containing protein
MADATKRQSIEACLREITALPDFPAFSECIQHVMSVLEDEETSLRSLTSTILRDYSLTLKVLRTANSSYYNRSGKAILSVTHATAMLGVEAIRDLAGSLMFFDHFRKRSPGLKELVLLSLLTANHARQVAKRIRYPRLEEAYLCGMFRNMGEILLACAKPREYAEILSLLQEDKLTEREACLRVMRFTYDDLGRTLARHWKMPEKVSDCMTASTPRLRRPAGTELELLQAVTSFSHTLTAAIYRRDPKGARASVNLLLETYSPVVPLAPVEAQEIAKAAIAETKETFTVLRVPLDDLRLQKQAEHALAGLGDDIVEMPSHEDLLDQLTGEVETALRAEAGFDLNSVILMIVEAIHRGGPFDRVLFALVSADGEEIRGKIGLGEDVDGLIEKFRYRLSLRAGRIPAALLLKQDLLATEECFGLCPVVVDGVLVGCLYFERRIPILEPAGRLTEALRKLRDYGVIAIRKSRQARSLLHAADSEIEPVAG